MKNFTIDLANVLNLQNFSGVIPLFQLATVVFFPNTLLPLHVFEPRYRQMVKDIIDGERIIGMVLLKPGREKSYEGNPEIYSVVGMGRIVNSEPLDDGRFNIVLYILKRNGIIGKEHESHLINIDTRLPLENLIDAIASTSVSNVFEKQELLEEINVQKRAENILTYLETKVEVISIVAKRRNQIVEKRNLN